MGCDNIRDACIEVSSAAPLYALGVYRYRGFVVFVHINNERVDLMRTALISAVELTVPTMIWKCMKKGVVE